MVSKSDRLHVPDDVPMGLVLEHQHIEQAIIKTGFLEKHKWPAIKTPIPHEDKTPFAYGTIHRLQTNNRRGLGHDLSERQQIAHGAERLLEIRRRPADDFGIETDASQLNEILIIGHREIHLPHMSGVDHLPCLLEVVLRDAELCGENVHRPHGKNAEIHIGSRQTIDHFIHRTIPPGRHDSAESLGNSPLGQIAGLTRRTGGPHDDPQREGEDFFTQRTRSITASGWVENDEHFRAFVHAFLSG